jgi:hypothetical protein
MNQSKQELLPWLTEGVKCLDNLAVEQNIERNHLQLAGLFDWLLVGMRKAGQVASEAEGKALIKQVVQEAIRQKPAAKNTLSPALYMIEHTTR